MQVEGRVDQSGQSYLNVRYYVMKGDYDAILPWPIQQKVTITILADGDIDNKTTTINRVSCVTQI